MKYQVLRLLIAATMLFTIQLESSAQEKAKVITTYIFPGGWPIPKHSAACERNGAAASVVKPSDAIGCGPAKSVAVPKYSLNPDGSLYVLTQERYAENLYVLKYGGVTYGYTAMMFGGNIASATQVTWLDEDGDGKFTKLVLGTSTEVPPWVKRKPHD